MDTAPFSLPLRVGVIGLGRFGLFQLERWADRPDVIASAACDHQPRAREIAMRLCIRVAANPDELLALADIDAILIDVPVSDRSALARRALAAGKHLVTEPPLAATTADANALYAAAKTAGRRLVVWSPWRDEADYRAADAVVRSGQIGELRLVRHERWEPMASQALTLAASCGVERHPSIVSVFDQLIALARCPATSISATSLVNGGLTITIRFAARLVAVLTRNVAAATRLDHGWAIDAERGGYAAGRRWIRAADGEVYHLPAETTAARSLEDVLSSNDETNASRTEAVRLIALLRALDEALETGQVVEVEPTE